MPHTSPAAIEPSPAIETLLTAVTLDRSAADAMRAMTERESEFANPLAAKLAGIALHPDCRDIADQTLDAYWSNERRQEEILDLSGTNREVIIGGGFHAAAYAATRVRTGHPKPIVLESDQRVGGTFAMTTQPTFYLNSRNRAGNAGPAGDRTASLNYLPGALIQAANMSMLEYQANSDLAFVIRLALAQFADVVTAAHVTSVSGYEVALEIGIADRDPLHAGRLIDARGLGQPADQNLANGATVMTFTQFMQRMGRRWPLRDLRKVAVIGGGDSGKCTVESFLGLAPQPLMAAAALDRIERVDWYSTALPSTCDQWQQDIRGRYQAIGRYLRPDRFGLRRLDILPRRARPVALSDTALIDGRTYDLVVLATGTQETPIPGIERGLFDGYSISGVGAIARKHFERNIFRVGPHAQLPFGQQEQADGIDAIPANAVAIFRTAHKTAALAATLPALTEE